MMSWRRRYTTWRSCGRSLWLYPSLAIVAALIVAPLIGWIGRQTGATWFGFTSDGARAVLGAFTSSMLTFIVFVVTAVLIVVQLASATLTPRIIALTFERGRSRAVLTFFTFSFTYTVATSSRVTATVPQLPVAIAIALNLVSISVFFYYAYELAVDLRPIAVLTAVASKGRRIIESVYPLAFDPARPERTSTRAPLPQPLRTIAYTGAPGAILAFNAARLVHLAQKAGAVVELRPQVGDFVFPSDPLFLVAPASAAVSDELLRENVAVGPERTLEQDPRFAFRIIVDIANKALSPAINDPTTAVLAIDQIHRLLLMIGSRSLDTSDARDAAGQIRLLFGTPDWDDYVTLGATEIRHYGAGSIQVARRLFAMLEHLLQVLPASRHEPLGRELGLLRRSVERAFPDKADRASASVGDSQGTGGSEMAETSEPARPGQSA
jgi:uncharacterized membrane protein